MNVIFAEYNMYHNSIDIATSAEYLLRIDCGKAENGDVTIDSDDILMFDSDV